MKARLILSNDLITNILMVLLLTLLLGGLLQLVLSGIISIIISTIFFFSTIVILLINYKTCYFYDDTLLIKFPYDFLFRHDDIQIKYDQVKSILFKSSVYRGRPFLLINLKTSSSKTSFTLNADNDIAIVDTLLYIKSLNLGIPIDVKPYGTRAFKKFYIDNNGNIPNIW